MYNIVMIKNKFSIVLAEKLLKISKVSKDTGLSRTTLTNLYYRRTKHIDLETLEKLCKYLNCKVEDIIEYREEN